MAYAPTTWVDGVTPVNAVNLNKLENGLQAAASVALPADTVVAAATRIIANKLQAGDANNAFRFMGDGKHEWGPGGAGALDTNLYRSGATALGTDGTLKSFRGDGGAGFQFNPATVTGFALHSLIGVEANPRFFINSDGKMQWGPGAAAAVDTALYRTTGPPIGLKTDGPFSSADRVDAYVGLATQVSLLALAGKPNIYFGNGGDISLYREGAGVLRATGHLVAEGQVQSFRGASGQLALGTIGGTPTGAPQILFGSAADTNLYRQSAGYLMTDTSLVIKKVLYVDYGNTGDRLYWGSAGDAMIYRSAAGVLRTDAYFQVYYGINLDLGNGGARLNFGTTADTNLYRVAAGVLQTDGTMLVGNNLYVNGYIRYMAPALEESAVSGTNVRRIVILKGDGSFGGWIPVYN